MSWDDDYQRYEQEAAMEEFLEQELQRIAEEPVFGYLSTHGDAIEDRVRRCIDEAQKLKSAGYNGAALVRAAAGIEITIRFFLARPLLQGAFLSDDWSQLLSQKVLNGRTAEDRELLPAILHNWKIDITSVKVPRGLQAWEQIVTKVWPLRNDYLHKASDVSLDDAVLSIQCLEVLLSQVVYPLAQRIGFTREQTGCWSIIARKNPPEVPDLNPPRKYPRQDPFLS